MRAALFLSEHQPHVPEYDPYRNGDIERMLGAPLGDLEGEVGGVYDVLTDSVDLIAENQGIPAAFGRLEPVELDGPDRLLDADDGVSAGLQGRDGVHRVGVVLPCHAVLGSESGLVYLRRRGSGANAAEEDFVDLESVGGAEG